MVKNGGNVKTNEEQNFERECARWYLRFLVWYRKISGRVDFETVRSYHKMRSKENGI
jgi:hypothetical protein